MKDRISKFFFFFSSRRRHTRCSRDWSSDVCSSDLWLAQTSDQPEQLASNAARPPEGGAGQFQPVPYSRTCWNRWGSTPQFSKKRREPPRVFVGRSAQRR